MFSPRNIDEGSKLLLDHLDVRPDDRSLDLGCGYGPLGMTIAKLAPQGQHLLVDKDFVAVDYTQRNIADNGINCNSKYPFMIFKVLVITQFIFDKE